MVVDRFLGVGSWSTGPSSLRQDWHRPRRKREVKALIGLIVLLIGLGFMEAAVTAWRSE